MPIYAYRCSACGHAKEVLQKMSDPMLSVCPACGEPSFVKQVTAAGFQLKGSGWYVTDFRGDKKPATPAAEGAADPAKGESGAAAATPSAGGAEPSGAKGGDPKGADAKKGDAKGADAKRGDARNGGATKSDTAAAPAPAAAAPAPPAAPPGSGSK